MKISGLRIAALVATLALIAAACGEGKGDAQLPANAGDGPAIDAACLVDEPDCNDTPGGDAEPQDLPSDDSSGGLVIDDGLTVPDALATGAAGLVAVKGFVVADGDQIRLCELLAESFPPQCGGASIALDGFDQIDPEQIVTAQGVSWTDQLVTVLGEIVDGVLVTTSLSQ